MTRVANIDAKIWLALRSAMDGWTETAIQWPDEKLSPVAEEAFLIIEPVWLDFQDQEAITYDCGEEQRGYLNIRVMTPTNWDYAQKMGLLGRVASVYDAGVRLVYSDAVVNVLRQPRAFAGTTLEAAWHRQDLQVYWRSWG